MRHLSKLLGAVLVLALGMASASGQQWPERPVRLVIPYVPGAMGDIVARLVSDELRARLGQPFLVETRPGAGGNIGTIAVAQAPSDGYTFLVAATNNLVINQYLYKMPIDPLAAFDPVTVLVDVPAVIFLNGSVPARSFAEFVDWARANAGKVNYGSPGGGTTPHLSAESINQKYRLGMVHVSFKGSSQAVQALLGGDVQFYLAGAGVGAAHVKTGKLRALAVAAPARVAALPDVPTFDEVGIRGLNANNWWGLAAPAGTPPAIVTRLHATLRDVLAQQAMRERMQQLGIVGVANTPAEMGRQLREEADYWRRTLPELAVKPE